MVRRLLLRLRALDDFEGFLRGGSFVDDRTDAADHPDWIRGLPDVAAHVHSLRPVLSRGIGELERVEFRVEVRPTRGGAWRRAALHHPRDIDARARCAQ